MPAKYRVLVTSTSFNKVDPLPRERLIQFGCEIVENPFGRPLKEEELIPLLKDIDGIVAGLDEYSRKAILSTNRLKVISRYGVGVDNIDLEAAKERGILVVNTPEVNTQAVADLTFGLILAVCRKIPKAHFSTQKGNWGRLIGRGVYKKSLGIIGLGRIGKAVAERARGFSMEILAYDIKIERAPGETLGIRYVPLDELLAEGDFITLHCDLNPGSKGIIGAEELSLMKKTAYLINTARGGLIDENALFEALRAGKIAGAALDAFQDEPPVNSPLLTLDNIITTPHIGSYTHEALLEMGLIAVDNLIHNLDKE
ncbi:MAG: Glyoxylate reductase [Deltaproteobacteria bacterium]|jgi:D-3-phosphoglycerate dehydrogenase|nr:Glyoxylate reductase [Deltaproteobacteria bacterium]